MDGFSTCLGGHVKEGGAGSRLLQVLRDQVWEDRFLAGVVWGEGKTVTFEPVT